MGDSEDSENDSNRIPEINVNQMSNAIASNLASTRQHHIPVFKGNKGDDPLKFLRTFERVGKALKWDDSSLLDKFPNYLAESAEEWYYINVVLY